MRVSSSFLPLGESIRAWRWLLPYNFEKSHHNSQQPLKMIWVSFLYFIVIPFFCWLFLGLSETIVSFITIIYFSIFSRHFNEDFNLSLTYVISALLLIHAYEFMFVVKYFCSSGSNHCFFLIFDFFCCKQPVIFCPEYKCWFFISS